MGLRRQTVATQALLQAQLHQDAEANLLAMKHGMASLQLGQTVMHGVCCDSSTTGPAETADHSRRQPTGVNDSPPGLSSWLSDGIKAVDQQLVAKNPLPSEQPAGSLRPGLIHC